MRILCMVFVLFAVSGCAQPPHQAESSVAVERSIKSKEYIECLGETALDAAFDSDNLLWVRDRARSACIQYEHDIINSQPPAIRLRASILLEDQHNKIAEDLAVFAVEHMRTKKKYLEKFYTCSFDNSWDRILQEIPTNHQLPGIVDDVVVNCYDSILNSYLSPKNNKYSQKRKTTLIRETSIAVTKIINEDIQRVVQQRNKKTARTPTPLPARQNPDKRAKGVMI